MTQTQIKKTFLTSACLVLLAASAACKSDPPAAEKGSAGESCTRGDDCQHALLCVDNRCVTATLVGGAATDGGAMTSETRGQAGESCTRRADCQSKLACIDQVCVPEAGLTDMPPSVRGDRGETCQARNDCAEGLACVAGRCSENEYPVTVQPKECFRVECAKTTDCCENFVPSTNCPGWKTSCDAGDPTYCDIYDSQCKCQFTCLDELCVVQDTCTIDSDCGSSLLKCFDKQCAQCKVTADCADPDAACVKGVCQAACKHNEECKLFEACQSGTCVKVGCTSDRECLFATQDPLAKCVDKECITPCTNDAECSAPFHVCEAEKCVFVGCESNEECRVLLGLQSSFNTETAVCRTP
jgi:hypothetical protein